jgi:hypothetical protein
MLTSQGRLYTMELVLRSYIWEFSFATLQRRVSKLGFRRTYLEVPQDIAVIPTRN